MASIQRLTNGRFRARFRDLDGKEHARHFVRRREAQGWLDRMTANLQTGTFTDPKRAKVTVNGWADDWIESYRYNRASTVRQAQTHLVHIRTEFGHMRLASVRPTQVRTWIAKLQAQGLSDSYVYALHSRLAQLFNDAVHDDLLAKNPCSRRTAPKTGQQKPYVATSAQVWALYEAMPERLQATILLGAFVGLRSAEVCGLRIDDIDFIAGVVEPHVQYPSEPLKTDASTTQVPIPRDLTNLLAEHVAQHTPGPHMFVNQWGDQLSPRALELAFRHARKQVVGTGMDERIRFHDLRHYFASLLISSGADVKRVQSSLRHKSAKTTLDVYGHLWPDTDNSTRAAISNVITARAATSADYLRTVEAESA
jgi:integrase